MTYAYELESYFYRATIDLSPFYPHAIIQVLATLKGTWFKINFR